MSRVPSIVCGGVPVEGRATAPKRIARGSALRRAPAALDDSRMLMVIEGERVVGILTVENIGDLLALEAAVARCRRDGTDRAPDWYR